MDKDISLVDLDRYLEENKEDPTVKMIKIHIDSLSNSLANALEQLRRGKDGTSKY
jgi:general stress protein 26